MAFPVNDIIPFFFLQATPSEKALTMSKVSPQLQSGALIRSKVRREELAGALIKSKVSILEIPADSTLLQPLRVPLHNHPPPQDNDFVPLPQVPVEWYPSWYTLEKSQAEIQVQVVTKVNNFFDILLVY